MEPLCISLIQPSLSDGLIHAKKISVIWRWGATHSMKQRKCGVRQHDRRQPVVYFLAWARTAGKCRDIRWWAVLGLCNTADTSPVAPQWETPWRCRQRLAGKDLDFCAAFGARLFPTWSTPAVQTVVCLWLDSRLLRLRSMIFCSHFHFWWPSSLKIYIVSNDCR